VGGGALAAGWGSVPAGMAQTKQLARGERSA